jgi:hypothetical protein
VATIQDFRKDVELFVSTSVWGFAGFAIAGFLRHREARDAYTDTVIGPSFDLQVDNAPGLAGFPTYPDPFAVHANTGILLGLEAALRPGEKAFQFRCWAIEQDENLDVNSPALVVGMEIEVHRCLLFRDEEYLYTSDEMLANQVALLDKSAWRALLTLQELVAGPIIDDIPTRESNVISYTVSVAASVVPD